VWRICGAIAENAPLRIALTSLNLSFKSRTMWSHPFMFQYPASTHRFTHILSFLLLFAFQSVFPGRQTLTKGKLAVATVSSRFPVMKER
jgi:hypothetical protein